MWCDVANEKRVMSSATMMNHSRRQIQPPVLSNKRKERDGLIDGVKPSAITTKSLAKPSIHRAAAASATSPPVRTPQQPSSNNQLLAGYLAHEFLSKGTLFGEAWEPARAEAVPLGGGGGGSSSRAGEKRRAESSGVGESNKQVEKQQRYMEVAHLLKGNGAHISGVVNPAQLARFLQLR